jgi:hypothetical protein
MVPVEDGNTEPMAITWPTRLIADVDKLSRDSLNSLCSTCGDEAGNVVVI